MEAKFKNGGSMKFIAWYLGFLVHNFKQGLAGRNYPRKKKEELPNGAYEI